MKKIIIISLVAVLFLSNTPVYAQEDASIGDPAAASPANDIFYTGTVTEVISEHKEEFSVGGALPTTQEVIVRYTNGPRAGEEENTMYGALQDNQKLKVGDRVVLTETDGKVFVLEKYRLPSLWIIGILFVLFAVVFAGWKGVSSLIGLGLSIAILAFYVVPQIMDGKNPLVISLIGAFAIAISSIYLAHGFKRRTTVAVISTIITIVIAIGVSQWFVWLVGLSGAGSEEAFFLQSSPASFVNLRGLLLGGIVIGALGVLDDITTGQAAAVDEIWRANPKLSRRELYARGASVGKEHITSLINTLALAYVGASFPALLLFTVYERPWWVVMNTEVISEEIVRILVGSVALIVAVPITTFLASYWLPKQKIQQAK